MLPEGVFPSIRGVETKVFPRIFPQVLSRAPQSIVFRLSLRGCRFGQASLPLVNLTPFILQTSLLLSG
jgi:hypothetical protein